MNAKYGHIEDPILRKKMTNKNRQLKCRYGITLEDYNQMVENQDNKCKLCNKEKRLVVEHNHRNGKVRGLTCDKCNILIAHLEESDLDFITKVTTYLNFDGNLDFYKEVK